MKAAALILTTLLTVATSGPVDDCPILQTTDARTPCHIRIDPHLQADPVPPFVYMINLPESTPQQPCPFIQTLDRNAPCYTMPRTLDDSALYLQVPLPPRADELDESPTGIAKLRQAKFKTLTQTMPASPPLVKTETPNAPSAVLPSNAPPIRPEFQPLPEGNPEFTVAYSPPSPSAQQPAQLAQPQPTQPVVYSPPPSAPIVYSPPSTPVVYSPPSPPLQQLSFPYAQSAPPVPRQYYGI